MAEHFSELVDRVHRGEPGSREAVLAEVRKWLGSILFDRFNHLKDGHAEMLDQAEVTLLRWLYEKPHLVRRDQAPSTLAWRLLAQTGKQWVRDQKHEREALAGMKQETKWGARWNRLRLWVAPVSETGWEATGSDAARAVAALPEPHRSTLQAQVEHQLHGGQPLSARFGISEGAARVRLCRAREALLARIREGKDSQS